MTDNPSDDYIFQMLAMTKHYGEMQEEYKANFMPQLTKAAEEEEAR